MKRIVVTVLIALLLVACTSKEQKAYEDYLLQAKDKISAEEFDQAIDLLREAISTGFEENMEAQNLLDQLKLYQKLESLLDEGNFEEVYETIEDISQIENGSTVITNKAKEFKEMTEKKEQQFNELQMKIDEALKLAENKNYEEANERLKALDLSEFEESYYESIQTKIAETITSNDKQIAAIKKEEERKAEEARKKAAAEKKAQEEAARRNNMLTWSNDKIMQYIADYFGMNMNHMIIEVYDRSDSGYSIEARQHNAAMGVGDPAVAPALGFFEVRADGGLYQMDVVSGDFIRVN